jgi:predicted 3-demethylubiquinone-9 3-methyltransferase (glyoxalase superfamily)
MGEAGSGGIEMQTITPFLWFQASCEEPVKFYQSVFKDCKVDHVSPQFASFTLNGQKFHALNGGPQFKFNEAVSFFISVETQDEVDYYWEALTKGGETSQCGWLKDPFGVSWQVIPTALNRMMGDPDRAKAGRVMAAMLKMTKIEIDGLQRAYDGK